MKRDSLSWARRVIAGEGGSEQVHLRYDTIRYSYREEMSRH